MTWTREQIIESMMRWPDVGEVRATKIVDAYDAEWNKIAQLDADQLQAIDGISPSLATAIALRLRRIRRSPTSRETYRIARGSWPRRILWLVDRYTDGNQSEFARKIGVQPQSVNDLARGRYVPGTETLMRILERWPEVNANWLLTGKGAKLTDRKTHERQDGVEIAVLRMEGLAAELREVYGLEEKP